LIAVGLCEDTRGVVWKRAQTNFDRKNTRNSWVLPESSNNNEECL
jgi:hypothetical protein